MPASLPTVPVLCTAQDQTGAPLAGGRFEATLDRVEHYGGFVVPQVVAGVADAAGNCTLELWPNVLGIKGSTYRVRAFEASTGRRYLDAWAAVPNAPCMLQNILVAAQPPDLDMATTAAAQAAASAAAAAQSAIAAAASAGGGGGGGATLIRVGPLSLSGHSAVACNSAGALVRADCTDLAHQGAVLGVVASAYAAGADAVVQTSQVIEHAGWSWLSGAPVLVGSNGQLAQALPMGAVFSQAVGQALSPTRILIDVQPPVSLT